MELDRIQKMRDDLEKQKRQFKQTFQKAMTAAGAQPVRAKIPATRPKEFTFTSDQRLKAHERSKSSGQEPPEFSRTLRSTSASTTSSTVSYRTLRECRVCVFNSCFVYLFAIVMCSSLYLCCDTILSYLPAYRQ